MSLVGIEDRGAVRHIVLQRSEKRNAFNAELISDLGHALEDAAADSDVCVLHPDRRPDRAGDARAGTGQRRGRHRGRRHSG